MPMLSELRRQFSDSEENDIRADISDEIFVSDVRSGIRSTQIIDQKVGIALARDEQVTEERAQRFRQHPKG